MIGLEYGNTRVRARSSELLRSADYDSLLATDDLDRMLGELSSGRYRADIEAAVARYGGIRRLDEAVRTHLARELREVRSFYDEPVGRRLDLLLQRWDVRNLRAIVRSQARRPGAERIVPLLVPAGRLDEATLRELAGRPGLRATVDQIVTWRLPDEGTARRIRYEIVLLGDVSDAVAVEDVLQRSFGEHLEEVLREGPDDLLARSLRAEIDQIGVLVSLRLRAARLDAQPEAAPESRRTLPGGSVPEAVLDSVEATDDPAEVVHLLAGLPGPWREALSAWARHQDLARLAGDLDEAIVRQAVAGLTSGDPLSLDVPVGYVYAVEAEARNLRMIGRAIVHGLDPGDVAGELVAAR